MYGAKQPQICLCSFRHVVQEEEEEAASSKTSTKKLSPQFTDPLKILRQINPISYLWLIYFKADHQESEVILQFFMEM